MAIATIDFAAVGRVSRFAELRNIRLTDVSAKCDPENSAPLEPEFSHKCSIVGNSNGSLDVSCEYHFAGKAAEAKIVDIAITYLLNYAINSPEPLPESDLVHFSDGNGTLHSWPFVREFLHALTGRMGVPPFTLGVMHFVPMAPPAPNQALEAEKVSNSSPA